MSNEPREIEFDATDYLNRHFIGTLEEKNTVLMRFHANLYKEISPNSLLEFGGGPTIYSIISAASKVKWIHFTDYSQSCRQSIEKWISNTSDSFNWKEYIRYSLEVECDGLHNITNEDIKRREYQLRKSIHTVSMCDAWAEDPLIGLSFEPYDAIASNFCLDSITESKENWLWLNKNITKSSIKDSYYIVTCLWGVSSYIHNGKIYPSPNLQPEDIEMMYEKLDYNILGFNKVQLRDNYGYMMAYGQKL